jgi:hypothetical protein
VMLALDTISPTTEHLQVTFASRRHSKTYPCSLNFRNRRGYSLRQYGIHFRLVLSQH